MITIVDFGSGNVAAISNIYKRLNLPYSVASSPQELLCATKLILPGVGAFDQTMLRLNSLGFTDVLNEMVLHKKTPILGVCVGMQVMAKSSEEGELSGFGWIDATVNKLDEAELERKPYLPHMGWNAVELCDHPHAKLLEGIDVEKGFYFLHAYYFSCNNPFDRLCFTDYGLTFTSAVASGNIYGVQFHPEKSHLNGIKLFQNFASI